MSVNVATGETLQKLNLFDTKDISQLAPGLELTNTTGRNNTTTLRGITFDPDQGTGPAVQVYLNEVPTDAQTVYTALYDIQQIEVLRGPQGLQRGVTSPAGAITIRTRRPNFNQIEGYVQATGTEDHAYNVQGGISLPFSDTFAIRAAVLVDCNRLNQVYNVNRNEMSRSRTESARLTLGWKPTDNLTAFLTYQHLESDNRQQPQVFGPGNVPSGGPPFFDTARSGPAAGIKDNIAVQEGPFRFQNNSDIVNLNLELNTELGTLSFVGAHQNTILRGQRDLDVGNAVPGYTNVQSTVTPYKVNTAELRFDTDNEGFWNWGLGAFYAKQTGDVQVNQNANSFFGPFPVGFGLFLPIDTDIFVPVYSRTLSFNANTRFKFGDFTLEGGLRYSDLKAKQRADILVTSPGYPGFPAFGIPAIPAFSIEQAGVAERLQRRRHKPITGGATLTYEPSPDLTVYAAYNHSFRAGSSGVGVPAGISDDLVRSEPEKTDSFEVGLRTSLLDRRLNLSVAAFYQKFDGFLSRFTGIFYNCQDTGPAAGSTCSLFNPNGTPTAPINNATDTPAANGSFDFNYNGDATVKGIEATIDGRLIDTWDFSVSASYIKGRYNNALLPCNDFNGDGTPDAVGTPRVTGTGNVSYCRRSSRIADVPNFSLTANTELRFPIGDLTPFIRGLVSYRPSVFSERASFNYETRTILNLYVGVRGANDRWEINAFAKNVLNQRKITNISQNNAVQTTAGGDYNSGYRLINSTTPREFGLTSIFRF